VNIQRALAVFAAVMIVCAVALGTLEPRPTLLGELLARIDGDMPGRIQAAVARWFGPWIWNKLALPLMLRPAWLPPVSLALVAVGLALSLTNRKTPHRSRRRS